ncbi:MAG: class II aldolase/adducin family protein [bacterium]
MKFSFNKDGIDAHRDRIVDGIVEEFIHHGHQIGEQTEGVAFQLNATTLEHPRAARRHSQSVFIVSLVAADRSYENLRSLCYTTLIRTLSNLLIYVAPDNGSKGEVYVTTPEAGFYHLPQNAEQIYRTMLPIVGSHYAIGNQFSTDLPEQCWQPTEVVQQIQAFGKELDALGVLPLPFPLRSVLTEQELHHLYKIYGITGLSYGNLSARETVPELGSSTFWMSGRGVNKSNLAHVGKDILLVKGFDYSSGSALVSVPSDYDPKARVSVDAVEHELIYRSYPDVHAIVHVHAWMDNILCTRQNYPCGTVELAEEVVELLRNTGEPQRTVVGLKNHGLTITGPSLEDIFNRIRGKLLPEVPMFT